MKFKHLFMVCCAVLCVAALASTAAACHNDAVVTSNPVFSIVQQPQAFVQPLVQSYAAPIVQQQVVAYPQAIVRRQAVIVQPQRVIVRPQRLRVSVGW